MILPFQIHKWSYTSAYIGLMGGVFLSSSLIKAVNVYSFSQTINSFCGLLGLDGLYGYGVLLAISICTIECLLPLLSISNRYRGIVVWCYPVMMGYFTYITFINYTDLYGGIESCGCFGELIHLSPAASFYKNVVLLLLSVVLLALNIKGQWSNGETLFPSLKFDAYIVLALAASIVPPLFSFFFLNRLPHIPYLLLYLALCVMGIVLCVKYVIQTRTLET